MLFHNNGDGTFTDVSESSGIGKLIGKGMGVAFADYDGDGFTDVFVSNDTFRNFLFHNNGNGTRPDIFVVGMVGDTFPLFRNTGKGFWDITSTSGVARATASRTAWGAGIADFDNDGFKDLFAACAAILDNSEETDHLPSKLPNLVLRNLGNGHFADVSRDAGPSFQVPERHRGVAFGDLNNDGKIDAVVTALNAPPEIFINRSPEPNHWLLIRLVGTKSNRDGLGAKVKITTAGGSLQYNHATTSTGIGGSSDRRVHFGLGTATRIDKLE